jgi:Glyoxalase/Bleomycin resistance protein/Dioxygenase superfamily
MSVDGPVEPGASAPPVLPGPIRQNAYLVRDLRQAMDAWLGIGVGPWYVLASFPQADSWYRGQATAPVVSVAFANSGALQVELIEQEDEQPSIYKEFLDGGRVGFHHIAFWSEEFATSVGRAEAAGWPVVHRGTGGGIAQFAYVDAGGFTSTVVEIMELNDITRAMTAMVRDAAVDWDGKDPVRRLN